MRLQSISFVDVDGLGFARSGITRDDFGRHHSSILDLDLGFERRTQRKVYVTKHDVCLDCGRRDAQRCLIWGYVFHRTSNALRRFCPLLLDFQVVLLLPFHCGESALERRLHRTETRQWRIAAYHTGDGGHTWTPVSNSSSVQGEGESNIPVRIPSGRAEAQCKGQIKEEVLPERAGDGCDGHDCIECFSARMDVVGGRRASCLCFGP